MYTNANVNISRYILYFELDNNSIRFKARTNTNDVVNFYTILKDYITLIHSNKFLIDYKPTSLDDLLKELNSMLTKLQDMLIIDKKKPDAFLFSIKTISNTVPETCYIKNTFNLKIKSVVNVNKICIYITNDIDEFSGNNPIHLCSIFM